MKVKQKQASFPSKPRATQRRNSLQRIKNEVLRRNVRILLSPLPDHFSPFRISRKSITNFSPRNSRTPVNRHSIHNEAKGVHEQTVKSPGQAPIVKSPRKRTRRKNEAEKLQEELKSKKYINDENIFRSRRALRSRLILTPKSPLVRVKKITRQSATSRKLSLTTLNKSLSREVVIELEKLPINEKPSKEETPRDVGVEKPQSEAEQDIDAPQVQTLIPRDLTILLEKLDVEPEEVYHVPNEFPLESEENLANLKSTSHNEIGISRVFDSSKDVPLQGIRILLEKLPDTVLHSTAETSHSTEIDTGSIFDSSEKQSEETESIPQNGGSIKKQATPSKTPTKQVASPVTPAAVSKSLSTPITTPIHDTVGNTETGGKKTPKSLDIPLRRVTIVKSKFVKMNRALESPVEASPIKVRPSSAYLFSPSTKTHASRIDKTKTKISWSNSRSESSTSAIISPPSSPSSDITPDKESTVSEVTQIASSSSYIWKGTIVMPEVAKCSVVLKKVSGNCEGLSNDIDLGGSSAIGRLDCVGRIQPNAVWDYLSKVKKVGRKDILVLRFESAETDDEDNYQKLYSYFCSKNRLAVVGNTGSAIRDFYIMPLARNSSLPEVLLPLDGSGFEDSRPDLLLAVIIRIRQGHHQDLQRVHFRNLRQSHLLHHSHHHPAGSTVKSDKSTESQSEESPPVSQSTPLCTEVVSPLSRGQLLTQKSLASGPNPQQVLLIRSAQNVRSPKHHSNRDSGGKTPAKSPMNRGRLLMEQSLAASPNSGKEIRRSVSVGSTLNRSSSNLSSGRREPSDVTYKQKSLSAGDLLKISLNEKDQQMDAESHSNKDTSPIATPLDKSPTTEVFSNEETCVASLSTLNISDRSKSKSTPDVRKQRRATIKSVSRSQPDLSQKLTEMKLTKPSVPGEANLKNCFHIPKVKPGLSTSTKILATPSSSLPRSGFTPSPPEKSTLTQSVLNLATHIPSYHPASTYSRKLPTKPSQPTSSKPSLAKITSTSNTRPLSAKSVYPSGSQSSTIKPAFSSSSQLSSLTNPSSPLRLKVIPPYTSTPHPPTTEPPHSSSSHLFAKPFPVRFKDPRLVKSLPTPSQTISNRSLQTPQPPLTSPKPHVAAKPQHAITPSNRPPKKSKSGGLKVAYMGSRSSNNASFSKCLPSGPQYSPSYSKYLQNGFSRLPDANIPPKSKTPIPTSPTTSSILRWSTVKPWMGTKPPSPPKASSSSLISKSANIPTGPTASVQAAKPTGPSGSLMSSVFTSNPEYSPLCPQFDF